MESQTGASLIKLLDDPDEIVYEAVSQRIQELGPVLIPDLELAARQTFSPILHHRIEEIMGKLQVIQLRSDFADWIKSPDPGLFEGAWLIVRSHYPDVNKEALWKQIKPLRDEIWLEMSENLTGLEKIRIMNTLFFGHGRIMLNEESPDSPGNNYLSLVLRSGKANEHSMSLLYAIIAQDLGLPVYAVGMPDYPILSYVDVPAVFEGPVDPDLFEVLFYINTPDEGEYHSRGDITNYLIHESHPLHPAYYKPVKNSEFIRICLQKLMLDWKLGDNEMQVFLLQDLLKLWKL